MSDAPSDPEPAQPKQEPTPQKAENSDRADMLALGIGCAVFIVMFIAIVLVAMSDR
jgi:hypothetical protein